MEENNNEVIKENIQSSEPIQKGNKQNNNNGMSIASMVLGIVGLIVCGLPCGILAIIFSVMAKKKGKNGMATAGLVLGIIDVIGVALALILGTARIYSFFFIIQ